MISVASGSQRPSYPSSKPKRDWDKIEAEVKKEVCLKEWSFLFLLFFGGSVCDLTTTIRFSIVGERRKTRRGCSFEQVFPRHIQGRRRGYEKGHAKIICKASF